MTRRLMFPALALVFATIACAGVGLTAVRASAVFAQLTETGRPGYLTLALDSTTPTWTNLAPGQSMRWLVETSLHDADTSTLAVELRAGGKLIMGSGMTAQVEACSGSFELSANPSIPSNCLGDASTVLPPTLLTAFADADTLGGSQGGDFSGELFELADLRSAEPRQVLVTVTIPAATADATIANQTAEIGLGVHAAGHDPTQPAVLNPVAPAPFGAQRLAVTSADALPVGLLAVGLAGIGALVLAHARSRSGRPTASRVGGER